MREPAVQVVFAVALVTRLAVFLAGPYPDPSRAIVEDSSHYVALARNLVQYQEFGARADQQTGIQQVFNNLRVGAGVPLRSFESGLLPESFRTPGYPLLIATLSLMTSDIRLALLLQCLLGALAAAWLVSLSSRLGAPRWASVMVGVLWACHPALVTYDNLVLTETAFLACTVAVYLLSLSSARHGVLWAALLLGVATMIRPPLGLAFMPGVLALAWARVPPRRLIASIGIFCLLPGLWAVRNYAVGEGFRVSTVGDMSLVLYASACADSETRGEDCDSNYPQRWQEIQQDVLARMQPGEEPLDVARERALVRIQDNGAGAIRMYVKSVLKLAVGHSLGSLHGLLGVPYTPSSLFSALILREGTTVASPPRAMMILATAWVALNGLVVLTSIAGVLVLARRRRWALLIATVAPVMTVLATAGAVGQERLRLPILMPMLLLTAVACGTLSSHFGAARSVDRGSR